MTTNHLVTIEKTDTGYNACVPGLLRCTTIGDTLVETETNIRKAMLFHLEGLQEDGWDIPIPHTQAITMPTSKTT